MASLIEGKQVYGGKWTAVGESPVDQDDINAISNNVVVQSEYGLSLCMFLKTGGAVYCKLSTESKLGAGESMELSKAKVVTLVRGDETMQVIKEGV